MAGKFSGQVQQFRIPAVSQTRYNSFSSIFALLGLSLTRTCCPTQSFSSSAYFPPDFTPQHALPLSQPPTSGLRSPPAASSHNNSHREWSFHSLLVVIAVACVSSYPISLHMATKSHCDKGRMEIAALWMAL